MDLTEREHAILAFAGRYYRQEGARHEAIRTELGLTATAFWQLANAPFDRPEALAAAPLTVNRLRRIREQRERTRRQRAKLAS